MPEPKGKLVTPVGFDKDGNLVALMLGADGRLQATVAVDANGNPIRVLADDTGKLITRSNVLFYEDFESGISAWGSGHGTLSQDTTSAAAGGASLKAETPATAGSQTYPSHYGLPLTGKVGWELWFRFDENLDWVQWRLSRVQNGQRWDAFIQYTPSTGAVEISEDFGTTMISIATITNGLYGGSSVNMWHFFRVVVNFDTGKYVTLQLGGYEWDVSAYSIGPTSTTSPDFEQAQVRIQTPDDVARDVWIDEVKVTKEG